MTSVIFAANDGVKGVELWRLDSATGEPVLVKDINPGAGHSQIGNITKCGNYAFFTAYDGQSFGLYHTDGSESGTVQLISLPNVASIDMVVAHGTLYFTHPGSSAVFKSDGTPEGTVLLFQNGNPFTNLIGETANGLLFQNGSSLYQTDGTVGAVTPLASAPDIYDQGITVNGVRYFTVGSGVPSSAKPWRSDGTVGGTYKIDVPGIAGNFVNLGSTLYFLTVGPSDVRSLWRSDGTNAGTVKVRDLVGNDISLYSDGQRLFISGSDVLATSDGQSDALTIISSSTSLSRDFRTANGVTYFTALAGPGSAMEPWRTDGTAAGTYLLKDIRQGTSTSNPAGGIAFDGKFLFSANDGIYGQELWISDGTTGGTVLKSDIGAISRLDPSSIVQPASIVTFQNASGQTETVFIAAEEPANGSGPGSRALYYSVGNGLATRLGDIASLTIRDADAVGTSVFFWVGGDLFRYTGNGAPVELVKSDVNGNFGTAFNGEYYFASYGDLWKSDGTSAGTTVVKALGAPVSGLVINNGKLYLNASGPSGNLWVTDGTTAGTILLRESTSGSTSYGALELTAAGNLVFFVSSSVPDMQGGDRELFATDGTTVFRVKDIWPGFQPGSSQYLANSDPAQLRAIGNTLYFTANNGVNGRELWKSDGTDAGTVMVKDINLDQASNQGPTNLTVGGDKLFFLQTEPFEGTRLWVSDGTAAGTTKVAAVTGPVSNLTSAGGGVVFTYNNGTNGLELWRSDGTSAGTFMVADLTPGAGSTTPIEWRGKDGIVYFSFAHPVHGIELWRTDGTTQGTFQVSSAETPGESNPYGLTLIEANLPTLVGTEGNDRLEGTSQTDWITAGGGNDVLIGGLGADRLEGGSGIDTADYTGNFGAVWVNLATGAGRWNYAEGDTYVGIENVVGTEFNDRIVGNAGINAISGGGGDDLIFGGAGADVLDGGAGEDMADYSGNFGAVWIDLAAGTGRWNWAEGETLTGFENVTGTSYGDRLYGSATANKLYGGDGDDLLSGGLGGDVLDGGSGIDTADYRGNFGAVWVNLASGTGQWNYAHGDTYAGIENVVGTDFNDRIEGDAGINAISGGGGDDRLVGGAGADLLDGGAGEDTADYSGNFGAVWVDLLLGSGVWNWAHGDMLNGIEHVIGTSYGDRLHGSAAANKLYGGDGDDALSGSLGTDLLEGGEGNDGLAGGADADVLNGGAGEDTADYTGNFGAVWIDLAAGTGTWNWAHGDILTSIENARGSTYDDWLFGSAGVNKLYGADGNDRLVGNAGADLLDGGTGEDMADYTGNFGGVWIDLAAGTGNWNWAHGDVLTSVENVTGTSYGDWLYGSAGDNRIYGGDGIDRLRGEAGNDLLAGGSDADNLDGGAGEDTADYSGNFGGVWIDLVAGAGSWNWAHGDTLSGIENVVGTSYADWLYGSGAANRLEGGDGDDRLVGGAGNDRLIGGAGQDVAIFAGLRDDYRIEVIAGEARVTDLRPDVDGDDGQDFVSTVETIRFKDGTEFTMFGQSLQPTGAGNSGANALGMAESRLIGMVQDMAAFGARDVDRMRPGLSIAEAAPLPDTYQF